MPRAAPTVSLASTTKGSSADSTDYLKWTIRAVLLVYAGFIANALPQHVAELLYSGLARIVFVALILAVSLYDEVSGILLAIGFIVSLQTFNRHYIGSKMNGDLLQHSAMVQDDNGSHSGVAHQAAHRANGGDPAPTTDAPPHDNNAPHNDAPHAAAAKKPGDAAAAAAEGFGSCYKEEEEEQFRSQEHRGGAAAASSAATPSSMLMGQTNAAWSHANNTVIKTTQPQFSAQGSTSGCYNGTEFAPFSTASTQTSSEASGQWPWSNSS